MKKKEFLQTLTQKVIWCKEEAEKLKELKESDLRNRPSSEAWNALECLEHLNRYGDFYLPEVEQRFIGSDKYTADHEIRSGFLGAWFIKMIQPSSNGIKPMKTKKEMNTIHADTTIMCIDRFLLQQDKWIAFLEMAKDYDINKVKSGVSINKWIKLRMCDALEFVILHQERHILQAWKAVNSQK
jgi:hypothetical protein